MAIRFEDVGKPKKAKAPKPKPKKPPAATVRAPTVGRPLTSEKHLTLKALEPWVELGMSRRTWYRRQKEKKG